MQHLQQGAPVLAERSRPIPARRDWSTMVCFSCGQPGHGVGRSMEKVGTNYMVILPRIAAERHQVGNDN